MSDSGLLAWVVDDDESVRLEVAQVHFQRCRVHGHENIRGVARSEDLR